MRPPQSPLPSREVMTSTQQLADRRDSALLIVLTGSVAVQVCIGLATAPSHGSALATRYGSPPATEKPPLEELNWVNAGKPP